MDSTSNKLTAKHFFAPDFDCADEHTGHVNNTGSVQSTSTAQSCHICTAKLLLHHYHHPLVIISRNSACKIELYPGIVLEIIDDPKFIVKYSFGHKQDLKCLIRWRSKPTTRVSTTSFLTLKFNTYKVLQNNKESISSKSFFHRNQMGFQKMRLIICSN